MTNIPQSGSKEHVARTAKAYEQQLREEVNEEREKLGKVPIEEEDEDDGPSGGGGTVEKAVSTRDSAGLWDVRERGS